MTIGAETRVTRVMRLSAKTERGEDDQTVEAREMRGQNKVRPSMRPHKPSTQTWKVLAI